MKRLALVLLAACQPPSGPSDSYRMAPTAASESGRASAQSCGTAHGFTVRHPATALYVVPGARFVVSGTDTDGYSRPGSIWVAEARKDDARMWFHEYLHALYGLGGMTRETHPPIFTDCGILSA